MLKLLRTAAMERLNTDLSECRAALTDGNRENAGLRELIAHLQGCIDVQAKEIGKLRRTLDYIAEDAREDNMQRLIELGNLHIARKGA